MHIVNARRLLRLTVSALLIAAGCSSDHTSAPLPAPTITSLSNSTGVQGTTTTLTLVGANFVTGGTTVAVSGTGVTASSVSVASENMLTVTLTIASTAELGARSLTVTTSAGTSGAQTFTINPPVPALTGVTPAIVVRGATTTVTLTGGNFISASSTTVAVSGADITVQNTKVVSATSITADLVVGSSAALGGRTISVTTTGGTSGTQGFTINPPAPTIASLSASAGVTGTSFTQTITGSNFVAGTSVAVSGSGVSVSNVTVASPTSITATFTVATDAAVGSRAVTVTTSGGSSGAAAFTVNPPAPTATGVTPAIGVLGTSVPVTISGSNFVSGATSVSVSGTGVTVGSLSVTNSTTLTATLAIDAAAALGARTITVTNAGGTTATLSFTIIPPTPTVTTVTPSGGSQRTSVTVTLAGTNFVPGATVNVDGAGLTVDSVNVASGTSMTARITIAASAVAGDHNLTVTTSGGTSAAVPFRVFSVVPFIGSMNPVAAAIATAVGVNITGANFVAGGTSVSVSGTGVTVGAVNVTSTNSLAVTFTVSATADLGARNVTVSTSNGTSNTATFSVVSVLPVLSSISPANGAQGGVQTLTLTGTDFVPGATTLSVSGANVTANNVNVASSTSLTADFTVDAGAALGSRDVTVNTRGGTSGAQSFNVIIAPSITSFAALSTHVTIVQPVTLALTAANAPTCSINNGIGSVGCTSSTVVTPGTTKTFTASATSAGATVNASSQVFVNEPGRWLYSSAFGSNQVRMWSIDPTTGDITAIGAGTAGTAAGPNDVAVDPSGHFAYAADHTAGRVSEWTIDQTTGALTNGGSVAASAGSTSLVVDPTGRWVYVVNDVSAANGSSISEFSIGSTGALTAIGTVAAGNHAQSLTVDPLSRYVYATNQNDNTISLYKINADGTLAANGTLAVPGNPPFTSQPRGITVDPTGRFVYVTERIQNRVHSYSINSDGTLTATGIATPSSGTMTHVAVDATGRWAYVPDLNSGIIHTFAVDQTTGVLTEGGSIGTAQGVRVGTEWIVSDPQGKWVYTGNGIDNSVSIFAINQSTGHLTLVATHAAGSNPQGLAVSR